MSYSSISTQLAIRQISDNEFISNLPPVKMGNAANIAYGGSTQGVAVNAACATVPSTHKLYSVLGHFLGPTSLDQPLTCRVTRTRDTPTFATRRVEVSQVQKAGKHRVVLELIADFHVVEPGMFEYSAPPTRTYEGIEASRPTEDIAKTLVEEGKLTEKQSETSAAMFESNRRFFESRLPKESMSTQNLNGMVRNADTTQNDLPITQRTTADWMRLRERDVSDTEQLAALTFYMDGGLAFLPLSHHNMFILDGGACSSLDFALRIYRPGVDLGNWHFRERTSSAASVGRTYTEGRLWDEQGNMIASMTQQGILRPPKKAKASL